jgi:hypothetical protein
MAAHALGAESQRIMEDGICLALFVFFNFDVAFCAGISLVLVFFFFSSVYFLEVGGSSCCVPLTSSWGKLMKKTSNKT